jgi:hypothetical protein
MNFRPSFLFALAGTLLLLGAGCGGTHKTVPSGSGKLLVKQTLDLSGPLPIEGEYSYVRIEHLGGDRVAEHRLRDGRTTVRLGPGSYRLVSYQRTCDGNCGMLDSPSERCSSKFAISIDNSSKPLSAAVRVRFGSGCTIRFAP